MASTQEDSSNARPRKKPSVPISTLSLGLGYCICAGSVFAKAPQIVQILRAGSAAGLSVWMPLMEVLGCEQWPSFVVANNGLVRSPPHLEHSNHLCRALQTRYRSHITRQSRIRSLPTVKITSTASQQLSSLTRCGFGNARLLRCRLNRSGCHLLPALALWPNGAPRGRCLLRLTAPAADRPRGQHRW